MRIISKFHDYYDIGLSLDLDNTLIYDRKTEIIDYKITDSIIKNYLENIIPTVGYKEYTYNNGAIGYSSKWYGGILGFCGKLYPCYELDRYTEAIKYLAFTSEQIEAFLDDYHKEKFYDNGLGIFSWITNKFNKKCIESLQPLDYLSNIFSEFKTPIFYLRNSWYKGYKEKNTNTLYLNPRLVDTGFPIIKDAYTTYQDISMFLGGVLASKGNPIIEITDNNVLASKHGFDKMSFRAFSPGTKKERRKRNKQRKKRNA